MILWPSDLPAWVEAQGFSQSFGDGRLLSKTTTGGGKSRRISTAVPKPRTASIKFTADQVLRFERFYEDEIAGGTLPFLVREPRFDGTALPFTRADGTPITISWHQVVKIASAVPQQSAVSRGMYYRYILQLLVMP